MWYKIHSTTKLPETSTSKHSILPKDQLIVAVLASAGNSLPVPDHSYILVERRSVEAPKVAGQEEVEAGHILVVRTVVVSVGLVVLGGSHIGWKQSVAELEEATFVLDRGGGMHLDHNLLEH